MYLGVYEIALLQGGAQLPQALPQLRPLARALPHHVLRASCPRLDGRRGFRQFYMAGAGKRPLTRLSYIAVM